MCLKAFGERIKCSFFHHPKQDDLPRYNLCMPSLNGHSHPLKNKIRNYSALNQPASSYGNKVRGSHMQAGPWASQALIRSFHFYRTKVVAFLKITESPHRATNSSTGWSSNQGCGTAQSKKKKKRNPVVLSSWDRPRKQSTAAFNPTQSWSNLSRATGNIIEHSFFLFLNLSCGKKLNKILCGAQKQN